MPRRPSDSTNWGGARPGAGRPSISDNEVTVSRSCVLSATLADRYDELARELGVSRSAALRAGLEAGVKGARKLIARKRKGAK